MIKVEIQDINDNVFFFFLDQIEMDISENVVFGICFFFISVYDFDVGENGFCIYLFMCDDYGFFVLDVKFCGDGIKFLELVIQKALDCEQQNYYIFVLMVLDGGELLCLVIVQINVKVIDFNDNSLVFEVFFYLVELFENVLLGIVVIDLNVIDVDEGFNGEVFYFFSSYVFDCVWEFFFIDFKIGLICVKGNLDYEENGMLEIDVQV